MKLGVIYFFLADVLILIRFWYIHFPLAYMLYLGARIWLELSCIRVNMVFM